LRLAGKRFIVTGGAGFIGSHLVDRLTELGGKVVAVDDLSSGRIENLNPRTEFVRVSIAQKEALNRVIRRTNPHAIFHLAATTLTKENSMGWDDPWMLYRNDVAGTLNILEAIVSLRLGPVFVYASSAAVYGEPRRLPIGETHPVNPISPYGVAKLNGEKLKDAFCREYDIRAVSLRLFNVYGPRQSHYVMYDLFTKLYLDRNRLEVLGTGEQIRDYCYVSDAVEAFLLAVQTDAAIGETFNIGSGRPTTISEVAAKVIKSMNLNRTTKITYTGNTWKGDIRRLVADISKAERVLGFRPNTNLAAGIANLRDWFSGHQSSRSRAANYGKA